MERTDKAVEEGGRTGSTYLWNELWKRLAEVAGVQNSWRQVPPYHNVAPTPFPTFLSSLDSPPRPSIEIRFQFRRSNKRPRAYALTVDVREGTSQMAKNASCASPPANKQPPT